MILRVREQTSKDGIEQDEQTDTESMTAWPYGKEQSERTRQGQIAGGQRWRRFPWFSVAQSMCPTTQMPINSNVLTSTKRHHHHTEFKYYHHNVLSQCLLTESSYPWNQKRSLGVIPGIRQVHDTSLVSALVDWRHMFSTWFVAQWSVSDGQARNGPVSAKIWATKRRESTCINE